MSTQSAATRTASQATVNAYAPKAQGDRQGGTSSDKLTALALMIPAGVFGWIAVDWLASILT